MQKNIYKIDGYFIVIGIVFLCVGILFMLLDPGLYHDVSIKKVSDSSVHFSYDDFNGRSLEQIKQETGATSVSVNGKPWIRLIFAINGVILLFVGIVYRKRENKIISIWNAIEFSGEVKVDDLVFSLGYNRDFVLNSLRQINKQHGALYVYDSKSDKIIDGRLKKEYPISINCDSCGAKTEQKISLSLLKSPQCQYCGSALQTPEHFEHLKNDILKKSVQQQASAAKGGFNVGIFIVLLLLFWPGAIYYAVKKNS